MPSERAIVDAYTRRALLLLRVGRGLGRDAADELRKLARDLRRELSDVDLGRMGRRDLAALLRAVNEAIADRYAALAAAQATALATLGSTEAGWATQAGDLPHAAGQRAMGSLAPDLLILGLPLARHWERQASNLADRVIGAIRTAQATGQPVPDLIAAIVGQGRRGRERGGLMEGARQQAATLADTATHAAAYAGRQAACRAGGIKYLRWHSILDSRTTIRCATRAGKLYTVDFQPAGHDIPMGTPPPAHFNCRSILVAMAPGYEPPGDGHDPYIESFDDWLKRQTPEEQDEMLGPTRAALWRSGKIKARDLLGRDGETLTVADLAAQAGPEAKVMVWTGEAKYRRLAGELTPEMRAAGERYGLAEYDMVAIRHYSQNGYEALNKALREGRAGRATVAADVLNEALGKLPAYTGVVVRRTDLGAALADHTVGNVVEYPAFTSATRRAKDVMVKKPVRLIINSIDGRDIATWSAAPWQEEILLGAPRQFVVKDRRVLGGETWIWLSEVQ